MPARPSARAHRLARYAPPDEDPDDVANTLARQVLALTIADDGPDVESQPSKLWTPRGEFQRTRPSLERSSDGLLSSAFGDILQRATSLPGPPQTSSTSTSSVDPAPATLQRQQTRTVIDTDDTGERPARLPRLSAAHKNVERQLKQASGISDDLRIFEEKAMQSPTLELYYEIRGQLETVTASIDLLNSRDSRVQEHRNELNERCARLRKVLASWSGVICLPKEPRVVDTSKLSDSDVNALTDHCCRSSLRTTGRCLFSTDAGVLPAGDGLQCRDGDQSARRRLSHGHAPNPAVLHLLPIGRSAFA